MIARCRGSAIGPAAAVRRQNDAMDVDAALPLLGGLSPAAFMLRHWQKKPLLVRQAWPGVRPPKWQAYPEIDPRQGGEERHAASDHAALWVDLDL